MLQQIHAHEIMHMMRESNQVYTKASLQEAIIQRFGEQSRFYTCSAGNMTASEIIEFFEGRDKFKIENGGLTLNLKEMCDH